MSHSPGSIAAPFAIQPPVLAVRHPTPESWADTYGPAVDAAQASADAAMARGDARASSFNPGSAARPESFPRRGG